jgi:hypothetical protein
MNRVFLLPTLLALTSAASAHAAVRTPASALAALPAWFEPNVGQLPAEVAYFSRGAAGTLLVRRDGARFQAGGRSIDLRWSGGQPERSLTGGSPLFSRSAYFTGRDAKRWTPDVAHFASVHQRQLYAGIDLVYYVADKQVEFDLVVAPGADPAVVAMSFPGARPALSAEGDLIFPNGMVQRRPVAYQSGPAGRIPVVSGYRVTRGGAVRLAVGGYDRTKPLVIDPVLHAGYLGGETNDAANAIAVDAQGNVWIAGSSASTITLPPQFAPIQDAPAGGKDAFLARLTPDATGKLSLSYWTQLGGSADDEATAIALDRSGFIYLAGRTASNNFPRAGTAVQDGFGGETDAFVARIRIEDSGLNALWFSQYYGGNGIDVATGMGLDADGNIYVAGYTLSDALPGAGNGGLQCCRRGGYEGFVAKIAPIGGTALLYGTFVGGTSTDVINAMAVDAQGDVYLTGYTSSGDFPVTGDAFQDTLRSGIDMFLMKLDVRRPHLDALLYGTFIGGGAFDGGKAIALGPNGAIWIGGYTESQDFPVTANAHDTGNSGGTDAILLRFDFERRATPQAIGYSTYVGGGGADLLYALSAGANGTVAAAGYTYSQDFPVSEPAGGAARPDRGAEAFLLQLDPALPGPQAVTYSTVFSGSQVDVITGVAISPTGRLYASGYTLSSDLPVTDQSQKASPGGYSQSFVTVAGATAAP